jgi:alkaline phosphatase D
MKRRALLQSAGWLALGYPLHQLGALAPTPRFSADPFAAGVASGDPTPDGVVLWTRLMPDANREQGWQREAIQIEWQIASDEGMKQIVRRGRELARPEYGHSVHVSVTDLQPDRWYWYQFKAGSEPSRVGRTKTAPSGPADRIRFAFASCQSFHQGYYTAYQHLVREDVDAIVFLGDYIYETGGSGVRPVPVEEPMDLQGYRARYGLYRSDPHLQEAHRLFPWIVTWDDHEVDNNYAGQIPQDQQARPDFVRRIAAAYQAHYEWLPLPKARLPKGAHSRLYRRLSYGPLANFLVLDGRQYRSDQGCGDGNTPPCPDVKDGRRTMLGAEQERWLQRELRQSRAQWNILANQVSMTVVDNAPGPDETYSMDGWSGYDAARRRLMTDLAETKVSNPVVITGDFHQNWVGDLRLDYRDKRSPVVGTELVGTSISSGGDGAESNPNVEKYLSENPQIKFFNGQRGYVRCEITPRALTADYRVVAKVSVPESSISTCATFSVTNGKAGAERV